MNTLHIEHLSISYGIRSIFDDLNWTITERERIGLVGGNGVGKSTLLKLLAGHIQPDSGTIHAPRGTRIGYLPQDITLDENQTVLQVAMTMPPLLAELDAKLNAIEAQLADPAVYENPDRLDKVLARQEDLLDEWHELGGEQHAGRVRELLNLLGFDPEDDDLRCSALSGGQKKLLALIHLVLDSPHFLLLDEPDNHLDLAAKRKLERFIKGYNGSVILVSHDRYLLDEVATKIVELDGGKLTVYHGNYTHYTTERELGRMRQQQLYVAQQKEITKIEAAIARFELWASMVVDERHIKQANSRRKMLERMEANGEVIEKVESLRTIGLEIQGKRGSKKALEVKDLSMGFHDDLLFLDLNFTIRHGERVGLIGDNGAGKSVLFQLILGALQPLEGEVIVGNSTDVGYYAQEYETLSQWLDRTPLELIRDAVPRSEGAAVTFLLKFLFTYEQVHQPIRSLSGGERSRLQFALLMLQNPNLLLLDEPTNNLDIPSVEVLESVLADFEGAVLVISHDRYFLDEVVDEVLELKDGMLTRHIGNYTDYAERLPERI